jgi:hypothetical protein
MILRLMYILVLLPLCFTPSFKTFLTVSYSSKLCHQSIRGQFGYFFSSNLLLWFANLIVYLCVIHVLIITSSPATSLIYPSCIVFPFISWPLVLFQNTRPQVRELPAVFVLPETRTLVTFSLLCTGIDKISKKTRKIKLIFKHHNDTISTTCWVTSFPSCKVH